MYYSTNDIVSVLRYGEGLSDEEIAEVLKDWDLIEEKVDKASCPL